MKKYKKYPFIFQQIAVKNTINIKNNIAGIYFNKYVDVKIINYIEKKYPDLTIFN